MQFPLFKPSRIGIHFDYIFMMNETVYQNQMRLYDYYQYEYQTFGSFRQDFHNITEQFDAFVIHNVRDDDDLSQHTMYKFACTS